MLNDTDDKIFAGIIFLIVLIFIGFIINQASKSQDQRCAEVSTILEHNNTIITFKENCAEYYTDVKGYSFVDFENPSFGPSSYTLQKK